ncbi:UNVERIFIED_CONTAM: hypothetical protein PYX00_000954 [Menopon gallinae]|uniref:Queuosine 5'-phosphate N-glycosylase/hydrolase n=1 Tax=Menopon gallinae TaxID=328185 RepID=A0AAW2IAZ4_9NEOP
MNSTLSPRDSGKYIAEQAKHVTIFNSGIKELAIEIVKHLQDGSLRMSSFSQCEVHPSNADDKAINWIFVVDTLNFCFWSASSRKWCVTWRGKSYTGYMALCAAINRALDEGFAITDPDYYSKVSIDDLKRIFRGDDESCGIPLLNERQKCLHEVGKVLLEKFDGSFVNCIKSCGNSAENLLKIIVGNFNCFKDEGVYNNVSVSFYKRAQILIGDIWVCFKGEGLASFHDIDKLTMFADYRVPQVLIHFKTMKYSDELLEKLKKDEILKNGEQEEMEIRGCSIHVVELVMNEIKTLLPGVKCNSILVDHFLWDYRRQYATELEVIPFHKTLSIFY